MLKKLRIKFIVMIMAMTTVVLVAAFSTICIAYYQQSVNSVYAQMESTLSTVSQVRTYGNIPSMLFGGEGELNDFLNDLMNERSANAADEGQAGTPGASAQEPADDGSGEEGAQETGPASAGGEPVAEGDQSSGDDTAEGTINETQEDAEAQNSPVLGDSSSSIEDEDGSTTLALPELGGSSETASFPIAVYALNRHSTVYVVQSLTWASLSDDILKDAIDAAFNSDASKGTLASYGLFFQVKETKAGSYVAFAETSAADGWQSLALTLSLVGLFTLLVFLVISIFFSRWALRPVENAWTQQKQFVADASHELKTPLTVILANTSILLEHPESTIAAQSQWLESTQTEARSMQGLVGDLLLLAQLDAASEGKGAKAPAKPTESVDFSGIVETQALQFESVAFDRGVFIESEVASGITVQGSAARLNRLASTLIDNACKYSAEGGFIDVKLVRSGKNAVFTVHNTGTAIDPADLPHIFDRFYRSDKARTAAEDPNAANSYGLGLAIAREIAQESGGDIRCSSNPESGTTFTVTLPL